MSVDEFDGLLDREEVLGSLPTKRAHTLLYLIESRTAHLVKLMTKGDEADRVNRVMCPRPQPSRGRSFRPA